jgi:hypothetical protein
MTAHKQLVGSQPPQRHKLLLESQTPLDKLLSQFEPGQPPHSPPQSTPDSPASFTLLKQCAGLIITLKIAESKAEALTG